MILENPTRRFLWTDLSSEEQKELIAAYAINFDGQPQNASRAVTALVEFAEKRKVMLTLLLLQQAEREALK